MFVLSCEPATCAIPEWHKDIFRGHEETVTSEEGWSPGSLNLAQAFATKLRSLLAHGDITRLLVDFSRRPDDPARFSRFSAKLTEDHRRKLDERHHQAHINLLRQRIVEEMKHGGSVIHLSLRTAPAADAPVVEFVQDPSRDVETAFVRKWTDALRAAAPELKFAVASDPNYGLSTVLREQFPEKFGSISVVAAQSSFLEGTPLRWDKLKKLLLETLPKE
ncbi:hypothetical protein [Haloferula sp. BvORR071]|uniref:hypothetical protein n=1 Tax=Haloferula sp. BvORR071 TaxID=1396141 RepID=UPI0005509CCA|nr:hypothetical protein [Haloferula sp. BvORR071]